MKWGYTLYYTRLGAVRAQGGVLEGCSIRIRVQPRASRDRIVGYRDGALRVSVTAPPVEGKANAAVVELLADALGIAKSRVRVVRGHTSRDKLVGVDGIGEEEVRRMLDGQLSESGFSG